MDSLARQVRTLPQCRILALVLALGLVACGPSPASESPAVEAQASGPLLRVLKERAVSLDPREHKIGTQVPDLEFVDLEGTKGRLSDFAERPGLVIALRDVGCPVGARIGPLSARLEARFLGLGVPVLYLNIASHNTPEEMRREIRDFGFQGRYVPDPEGRLASALGAMSSTDFFLLDPSRTLVYRGAADDQYGRGVTLPAARHHFLAEALEAMLRGQAPRVEATLAPGCRLAFDPLPASTAGVPTYHGEVSRIVQRNCVSCHREGGAGPFVLDDYESLKGRRGMVHYMLEERLMPPWLASEDSGPFEGDRRLSESELETLFAWYAGGMPLGDPAQAVRPLEWHENWLIGKPDHIFEDAEAFVVPAEGLIDLISTYVDVELEQDIWVDRIQVSASAPKVVHHSTVLLRFPEGHPNRSQAGLRRGEDGSEWRFFMAYLPASGSRIYPEGAGRMIPKGAKLRIVTHYTTNGLKTPNRMRIGVVEAQRPPELVVETRMLRRHDISIAPGAKDVRFDQRFRVPKDVLLHSVTPHMHYRGSRYEASVVLPDGERKKLIEIPQWDQDWQFSFVLRELLHMPVGSLIEYTAWYDNSADNPANPDPTQTVSDGPQIFDEMMMLWIEWIRPRVPGE